MYTMHGYCAGRLYFCMSISQQSTTCSDKLQNMAISYIKFFSIVILGELLITNTGGSYIIVTPAFTLPALIVVFKSMYTMHGYCAGRLYFCMSMSKLSTTCSDKLQNMAISYIKFFSIVILGELLLTNTGGSYHSHSSLYFTRAYCCIQVNVQNARVLCWLTIFLHEYLTTIDYLQWSVAKMAKCYLTYLQQNRRRVSNALLWSDIFTIQWIFLTMLVTVCIGTWWRCVANIWLNLGWTAT